LAQTKTAAPPKLSLGIISQLYRTLARFIPPVLALALLIFGLAWLIGLGRGSVVIDVGKADYLDKLYLSNGEGGFFQPETQQIDPQEDPTRDHTYRWTGRIAYINLPWPLEAVPLKATLRATAPRPDRNPDQVGTQIKLSGEMERDVTNLGSYEVKGFYEGENIEFKLPVHTRPTLERFRLKFEANQTYQPGNGDTRNLALAIFQLKIEPDYTNFGWRGWLASLARPGLLAIMALCCWGLGKLLWERNRWALIIEAAAGLLLLFSLWWWPLEAEPFYAAWSLILPVACLLLWLAGRFAQRAQTLPTPFVYVATLFPLLPLAQFAFLRLNLYTLNPASITVAFFTGALLFSAGIYVSGNIRQDSGQSGLMAFETAFVRAIILASLVSFAYNHFFLFQNNLYRGADFTVNYSGLLNFEAGKPLYDLAQLVNQPGNAVRVPPTAIAIFWPLARMFGENQQVALLVWRVINELLLIPILLILLRVFGQPKDSIRFAPAVLFLALNFGQIGETIAYGQYNILILLGMSLLALWVKDGRDMAGGAILALPIGLKLYPVISSLFFVTERRWRGLWGIILGGGLFVGLSTLVVGWNNIWTYATEVIWKVNKPQVDISNQSSFGFLARLAIPEVMDDYKGDFPAWVTLGGYLIAIGAAGLTLWVLWRGRGGKPSDDHQQLKLGAVLLISLIIPPFVWLHYAAIGLVALVALLVALSLPNVPRWQLFVFSLCYGMLAYGGRNDFFFTEAVGLARFGASYRFLAMVALWLLTLWLLSKTLDKQLKT